MEVRAAWTYALTLFFVSALVKWAEIAATAQGSVLAWNAATPFGLIVLLGCDAMVAIVYGFFCWGLLRLASNRPSIQKGLGLALRILVAAAGFYVTAGYYVLQFLGAPFNPRMAEAVDGMGDLVSSVRDFLTLRTIAFLLTGTALAALLPSLLGRPVRHLVQFPRRAAMIALAVAIVWMAGAMALARTRRTEGLEANALMELVVPRRAYQNGVVAESREGRGSLRFDLNSVALALGKARLEDYPSADLTSLSGVARGANVLLIVLESTAAVYLKLYGAEGEDIAPRLSELGQQGLVFDAAYTMSPGSMKSLFQLFCATHPYPSHKPETLVNPRLPCHSLSERLVQAGHEASLFHSGSFSYTKKDRFFANRGFDPMFDARTMPNSEDAFRNSWGVEERATVAAIFAYLDSRRSDRPFFVTYIPVFPHHPYDVPDPRFEHFGTAKPINRYRNSVRYVDETIGTLLDGLATRGLRDQTLVVVLSDHGEAFHQHPNSFGHASFLFEENVRVPLVFSYPKLGGSQRVRTIASTPDIAPTILDLLGLPLDPRHQGDSLLRPMKPRMIPMFTDLAQTRMGFRDGPWKYVLDATSGQDQLYHLLSDPKEMTDVVQREPTLAQKYREQVQKWATFQSDVIFNYQSRVGESGFVRPRPTTLADLPPSNMKYGEKHPRLTGSTAGKSFQIDGKRVKGSGIGLYANSTLEFTLEGYRRLKGKVARDSRGAEGLAAAEIYVDGQRVFQSGALNPKTPPVEFDIDLRGARTLELRALDQDGTVDGDHVDWLGMKLLQL